MAILIDVPTAPVSATPSLLATLQSIGKLCQTRSELSNEFESAFSSFLTDIPVVLSGTDGDILASSTSTNDSSSNSTTLDASTDTEGGAAGTTCAIESARPPNQLELEQVMEVWFRGEMELRESMAESLAQLKGFGREDLVRVVEQIERVEDARLKEVRFLDRTKGRIRIDFGRR